MIQLTECFVCNICLQKVADSIIRDPVKLYKDLSLKYAYIFPFSGKLFYYIDCTNFSLLHETILRIMRISDKEEKNTCVRHNNLTLPHFCQTKKTWTGKSISDLKKNLFCVFPGRENQTNKYPFFVAMMRKPIFQSKKNNCGCQSLNRVEQKLFHSLMYSRNDSLFSKLCKILNFQKVFWWKKWKWKLLLQYA